MTKPIATISGCHGGMDSAGRVLPNRQVRKSGWRPTRSGGDYFTGAELGRSASIAGRQDTPVLPTDERVSRHVPGYDNEKFADQSKGARGECQIREIERRPDPQANVISDAASHRSFHGMAE
jgi:hypothetical protein